MLADQADYHLTYCLEFEQNKPWEYAEKHIKEPAGCLMQSTRLIDLLSNKLNQF